MAETDSQTPFAREQRIADAYVEPLNERELDRLPALLKPTFKSHLRVGDIAGADAFLAMMEHVYDAFPDIEWIIEETILAPNRAVLRYRFEGTHRGPFLGIPPSGQFVRQEGAEVLHIEGERIAEIWNYTDLMGMAARLNFVAPLSLDF